MAAPTNYGQMQGQLMAAVWFLDLIGAPEGRKRVLAEIKTALEDANKAKAELGIARNFTNALAKIKNEIGQAEGEADRLRAEAQAVKDTAQVELDAISEMRGVLDGVEKDLKAKQSDIDNANKGLDDRKADLDGKADQISDASKALDVRTGQLDEEAVRLRGIKAQLEAAGKIKI